MNGAPGQYKIANGWMSSSSRDYNTDYQADYFQVYSEPIRTRYSEVFWAGTKPVPLPPDIVARFANKTVAVVGYEVDQVQRRPRRTAVVEDDDNNDNNNGETVEYDDVSVPITHAYNHHYCSWLVDSKKVRLVKTKASPEMIRSGLTHGSEDHWVTELLLGPGETENGEANNNDSHNDDPMVQFFSEGNGGEFRLSYHGYPKGYAQLIRSPDLFHIAPMQIDTWNREEPSAKYRPGPMPKRSRIPPSAGYSGLLECPCSDRIQRLWNMTYVLLQEDIDNNQGCDTDQQVQSETECWTSAQQVTQASVFRYHVVNNSTASSGVRYHNVVVDTTTTTSVTIPSGCSIVQHSDGTTDVFWNPSSMMTTTTRSGQKQHPILEERNDWKEEETAVQMASTSDKVAFAAGQVNITVAIKFNDNDDAADAVVITIVGPPDRWFGVGFGTNTMCKHMESDQCPDGGPYTILVQGDHVEERQLGYHAAGTVLPSSTVTVQRNEIVNGNRTVVLTRPRHGDAFSFDMSSSSSSVPIIMARGCAMEFAQHCGHGPADLNFVQMETPTRICQAGIQGTVQGRKFFQQGRCPSFPRGSLINNQYFNPTCKIDTYQGGLYCCNHGQSLLDKDQDIPWADQYLEYQLKFRFYYEEYQPAPTTTMKTATSSSLLLPEISSDGVVVGKPSHQNLVRLFWATEGNAGEYDIIQCRNDTPPSQCVQVITSRFQVRDMLHDCGTHMDASYCTGRGSTDPNLTEGVQLIYAGPHCHAPACLSVELYHANTGQLLCRVEPIYGRSEDQIFDERGYLAIPPCLWGDPSEGLAPPVLLPLDAELLSIKRNNNTLPHTGEMALWQMRGVVVPKPPQQQPLGQQQQQSQSSPMVVDVNKGPFPSHQSALRHRRRHRND